MKHLQPAGYIITDKAHSAIYGYGKTADEAWDSLKSEMSMAGIEVIGEIDDTDINCEYPNQTPANNYQIFAATAALLSAIEAKGGDLAWIQRGCVVGLPEECE